jgi:hypothetical protein
MGRSSALGQVTALRATPAPTVTVTAEPVGKRVSATKKARPTHITNPADLPKPPAPVPAAPATIPGDGTYPIDPSDVPVGTYRSSGPSESNAVGCYWALLGADGSSIINNDITAGAAIIVIGQDASFVKTSGCQTFTRTS